MNKRDRKRKPRREGEGHTGHISGRQFLRMIGEDVGYLEFKESIGEVLTDSQRFRLELARAERGEAQREGEGGES